MKKHRKIISALLVTAMMSVAVACGSAQGLLTDVAAIRGADEGKGEYYIDDEALALASRATTTTTMDTAVDNAFDLCNNQRVANNLSKLVWDDSLADTAKVRAEEITRVFSHNRPDGSAWWTVNSDIMYGENLAKNFNAADRVVTAWMASPSHAANILDPGFVSLGMAIFEKGNNWFWAQEFGY